MVRRKDRPDDTAILPGYRDVTEIGGGAFATVYRAIEEDTGRPVALKILKVDTVHTHLMETFTREIQALAQVSDHPNIVTLYRPLATPDGRPVLVLELCRESFAQQVRRAGPIAARQVTRMGIKIAGALETAHRQGFLHRDMKPQNILVSQFDEPVLSDFGVAALQASAQATAGVFGFTTLHAAPEILEGHHLSPATDIYGLASTMYQLLTGLAPFATFDNEAPASVILRIIRDPVRPLRSEAIPLGLSDLLESALSKDPEGRPSSAVSFADALVEVEAAAGWPSTAYVAWGDARDEPAAHDERATEGGAGRARLYANAPSVHVPGVARQRAADPVPASPPDPVPAAAAPTGPGPSVSAPAGEARQVVVPGQFGRGPVPPPAGMERPPLAPLHPHAAGMAEASPRPVFVDPPELTEPGAAAAGRSESIYEQTIGPRTGASPGPAPVVAGGPGGVAGLLASPLWLGAIAAAVVVVIAAILVALGVL